jgi:hypothetical protein
VPLVFAVAFAFAFAFPSADDIAFAVACAGTKGSRSVLLNSEHGDKQDHTRIKIEIEIRIWKEPNSTLDLDLDIRPYLHRHRHRSILLAYRLYRMIQVGRRSCGRQDVI